MEPINMGEVANQLSRLIKRLDDCRELRHDDTLVSNEEIVALLVAREVINELAKKDMAKNPV